MVSGLVTSPCDHELIFSGLARLMRIESKSAIRLARSYGLLRYKVVSSLPRPRLGRDPGLVPPRRAGPNSCMTQMHYGCVRFKKTFRLLCRLFLRLLALHQLDVQTQ